MRDENLRLRAEADEVDRELEAAQIRTRQLQEELEAKERAVQALRDKVEQQRKSKRN